MKLTLVSLVALLSASAYGNPIEKRADPTDIQILQYALTLEHLENAFYTEGLKKFDQKAFVKAGLPEFARGRFKQVAQHEQIHVKSLSDALGKDAVQPCTYKFPYNDPKSFAALSQALEGVGTSAYLGAAKFIQNKAYLTVAGSILVTEARHASWIAGAVLKSNPWSSAFETPLGLNQVFSLAAAFIVDCPKSNPTLPVKPFPPLTISANPKAGKPVTVTFKDSGAGGSGGKRFLALYTGLAVRVVEIVGGKATLPGDLQGTVYAVVSTDGVTVTDASTIAGPAILNFPFDSKASNP